MYYNMEGTDRPDLIRIVNSLKFTRECLAIPKLVPGAVQSIHFDGANLPTSSRQGRTWRSQNWPQKLFKLFTLALATCQHHPRGENLAIPKLAPEAARSIHVDVGNLPTSSHRGALGDPKVGPRGCSSYSA
jgi:hypothetical protein